MPIKKSRYYFCLNCLPYGDNYVDSSEKKYERTHRQRGKRREEQIKKHQIHLVNHYCS